MDAQEREHCRLDLHKVNPSATSAGEFVTKWGRHLDEFLIDPEREEDADELRETKADLTKADKAVSELSAAISLAVERLEAVAYADDCSKAITEKLEAILKMLETAQQEPTA